MGGLDAAIEDSRNYKTHTNKLEFKWALSTGRVLALVKKLKLVSVTLKKIHKESDPGFLKMLEPKLSKKLGHLPKTKAGRHKLRILVMKVRYLVEAMGKRSFSLEKLQSHFARKGDLSNLQSIFGKKNMIQRDKSDEVLEARNSVASALRLALDKMQIVRLELSRDRN